VLVFKYLLGVFKNFTIACINHPVKKYALSLSTVYILGLRDFVELSEDQKHMSKNLLQHVVDTQMSVSLSIFSSYGLTSK